MCRKKKLVSKNISVLDINFQLEKYNIQGLNSENIQELKDDRIKNNNNDTL